MGDNSSRLPMLSRIPAGSTGKRVRLPMHPWHPDTLKPLSDDRAQSRGGDFVGSALRTVACGIGELFAVSEIRSVASPGIFSAAGAPTGGFAAPSSVPPVRAPAALERFPGSLRTLHKARTTLSARKDRRSSYGTPRRNPLQLRLHELADSKLIVFRRDRP